MQTIVEKNVVRDDKVRATATITEVRREAADSEGLNCLESNVMALPNHSKGISSAFILRFQENCIEAANEPASTQTITRISRETSDRVIANEQFATVQKPILIAKTATAVREQADAFQDTFNSVQGVLAATKSSTFVNRESADKDSLGGDDGVFSG